MPASKRTQKELAQAYRGNLDYLRKFHGFRFFRTLLFVVAVLGSVAAAVGYRYFGRQEFFSTGPISAKHQRFADRCDQCHGGADPDLFEALRLNRALSPDQQAKVAKLKELAKPSEAAGAANGMPLPAGSSGATPAPVKPSTPVQRVAELRPPEEILAATGTMKHYDQACITCHEGFQYHEPQLTALNLRSVHSDIELVRTESCSTCHREHRGPGRMQLPPSDHCAKCHNDLQRMTQSIEVKHTAAPHASQIAQVRNDVVDDLRRFIPPRSSPHVPVAFDSFAGNHPAFGYEQPGLQDPAKVKYGHKRHRLPDVTGLNGGQQLDCRGCHKPGADGAFMQPVSFDLHCRKCHSLSFDPEVPEIQIPHGDSEKVRTYLNSLASVYVDYAVSKLQIKDQAQLETYVRGRLEEISKNGFPPNLRPARVFYTGLPPLEYTPDLGATLRYSSKSNKAQVFPGCAMCHEVQPQTDTYAPKVTPSNIAERWLTRGPFTHLQHGHMDCIQCHGAALTSDQTKDILLPAKATCVSCHRRLNEASSQPAVAHPEVTRLDPALVERQQREGGISAECQNCHPRYHAPADATIYATSLNKQKK